MTSEAFSETTMSVKSSFFQQADVPERALHQRAGIPVVREGEMRAQRRVDGAVIHPDADGDAPLLRRPHHLAHLLPHGADCRGSGAVYPPPARWR